MFQLRWGDQIQDMQRSRVFDVIVEQTFYLLVVTRSLEEDLVKAIMMVFIYQRLIPVVSCVLLEL